MPLPVVVPPIFSMLLVSCWTVLELSHCSVINLFQEKKGSFKIHEDVEDFAVTEDVATSQSEQSTVIISDMSTVSFMLLNLCAILCTIYY